MYTSLGSSFGYALLGHLDIGVPIFFLISAFLLYRPFVAARLGDAPAISSRSFYRRRVLRIVPGYWLALIVLGLYPGLGIAFGDGWAYYGLVHNMFRRLSFGGLSVSWSLCVEASFYLLLPLYSRAMTRWTESTYPGRALRRELKVLVALSASTTILQIYVTNGGHTNSLFFLTRTLPLCLDWFALGMFLALVSAVGITSARDAIPLLRRAPLNSHWAWWGASVVMLLGCVAIEQRHPYQPFRHLAYGLAAFCLVVPAVFAEGRSTIVSRALGAKWLAWLGLISYGIYLWQLRLLLLLHDWGINSGRTVSGLVLLATVGVAFTVVVAAASYYLFERKFLRLKLLPVR